MASRRALQPPLRALAVAVRNDESTLQRVLVGVRVAFLGAALLGLCSVAMSLMHGGRNVLQGSEIVFLATFGGVNSLLIDRQRRERLRR